MLQMKFMILALGFSGALFSATTAHAQLTNGNVSTGHSETYSGGSGGTYTYLDLTAYDISGGLLSECSSTAIGITGSIAPRVQAM